MRRACRKRTNRKRGRKCAPGWWWRFPMVMALLGLGAVALTLAAAGVGAEWNHMIGKLR